MTFTEGELGALLDLLKAKGVYKFKNKDLEVEFSGMDETVPLNDSTLPDEIEDKPLSEYEIHKSLQQL